MQGSWSKSHTLTVDDLPLPKLILFAATGSITPGSCMQFVLLK